jgi:hypothetical protein
MVIFERLLYEVTEVTVLTRGVYDARPRTPAHARALCYTYTPSQNRYFRYFTLKGVKITRRRGCAEVTPPPLLDVTSNGRVGEDGRTTKTPKHITTAPPYDGMETGADPDPHPWLSLR